MKTDHKKDKDYLEGLVKALGISPRTLHKDVYGYWHITGRKGYIDTDSQYWYVRIALHTKTKWQNVKKHLKFMALWQDGDDEGALRLERYPTPEEAIKIRKIIGINKSRYTTEEEKILLRELRNL